MADLNKPNTIFDRFCHLTTHHAGEMTEWENNFCLSNKNWIVNICTLEKDEYSLLSGIMTQKVQDKLKQIEDKYCGSICHALTKGSIGHG